MSEITEKETLTHIQFFVPGEGEHKDCIGTVRKDYADRFRAMVEAPFASSENAATGETPRFTQTSGAMVETFAATSDEPRDAPRVPRGDWVRSSDYDALEREVADLKHDIERAVAENTRLINENLAMERDAARYRWLRDSPPDVTEAHGLMLMRGLSTFPDELDGEGWDAAIDRAAAGKEV